SPTSSPRPARRAIRSRPTRAKPSARSASGDRSPRSRSRRPARRRAWSPGAELLAAPEPGEEPPLEAVRLPVLRRERDAVDRLDQRVEGLGGIALRGLPQEVAELRGALRRLL